MDDVKLYTVMQVAEILQTNKQYVYKLVDAGLLRGTKYGRLKIRHDDLLAMQKKYIGWNLADPFNPIPPE